MEDQLVDREDLVRGVSDEGVGFSQVGDFGIFWQGPQGLQKDPDILLLIHFRYYKSSVSVQLIINI